MKGEFRFMPEQASSFASDVDRLYAFLCGISGLMMVLIGFLILYFAIKYRRGSKADRRETHTHFFWIETAWIMGPFIIVMIMFFWGAKLYLVQSTPPTDALEITGVGRQWMWKFQHPEGRAEINDLHVPLGQNVRIRLISEDVIHSLFVPAFRVKQDVLPGRYTTLWFKPTKVGTYHLFCAEYCGGKHSEMRGTVHVMEPARYQQWLGDEAQQPQQKQSLLQQLRCVNCHTADEGTSRGPPLDFLVGRRVQLQNGDSVTADENYIRESILRPQAKIVAGYQPIMPTFEGQLSEEMLNRLIAEIKAASGQTGAAQNGAQQKEPDTGPQQQPQPPKQDATCRP
jgi:cytochrome c oxidase subunit II